MNRDAQFSDVSADSAEHEISGDNTHIINQAGLARLDLLR